MIEEIDAGRPRRIVYTFYDEYDPQSDTTSMARTTGYTCTAVVRLVAEGRFSRPGICPPEYLGEDEGLFESIRQYLAQRNVNLIWRSSRTEPIRLWYVIRDVRRMPGNITAEAKTLERRSRRK